MSVQYIKKFRTKLGYFYSTQIIRVVIQSGDMRRLQIIIQVLMIVFCEFYVLWKILPSLYLDCVTCSQISWFNICFLINPLCVKCSYFKIKFHFKYLPDHFPGSSLLYLRTICGTSCYIANIRCTGFHPNL